MPRHRTAVATMIALGALASVVPGRADADDAKPRIVSVDIVRDGAEVEVVIVGRDPDGLVSGTEIAWGEDGPAQGLSSCAAAAGDRARRRRGERERFEHSYTYPAAGTYTISVRVISGGCGRRPAQRSKPRTLTVAIP